MEARGNLTSATDTVERYFNLVPVFADQDVLVTQTHRGGQVGVVPQVTVLTVHGDEVPGSQQLVERPQLALSSVTRGVDWFVT
jgi:hypothetical protein